MGYTIFVTGSGGRDHALAWKYAQSPLVDTVYLGQGNKGIKYTKEGRNGSIIVVPELAEDKKIVIPRVVDFCKEIEPDLIDVAPENPLSRGLVDAILYEFKGKIPILGPTAGVIAGYPNIVKIESDRSFTKDLLKRIGVSVPEYAYFDNAEEAKKHVESVGYQVVVKANGLADGKGSIVCNDVTDAKRAIEKIMVEREFGDSGNRVLIEERKYGREFSFFVYLDGNGNYLPMRRIAQDYKAAFDPDDKESIERFGGNLNTGGMGAYSPHMFIDDFLMDRAIKEVIEPTVNVIYDELGLYKGVLYFGLNVDDNGRFDAFEINIRHGDPEAEVILPALKTDMFELAMATWEGDLNKIKLEWDDRFYVDVVAVEGRSRRSKEKRKGWFHGYPKTYGQGHEVRGLGLLDDDVQVFFAGVDDNPERGLVTLGGRVLHLVTNGVNLEDTVRKVYNNIRRLEFIDRHNNDQNCIRYRRTIGLM